jgi:hypothetical protein
MAVFGLVATGQAMMVFALLMSDSAQFFSDQRGNGAGWVSFLVVLSGLIGLVGVLLLVVAAWGALTGAGKVER